MIEIATILLAISCTCNAIVIIRLNTKQKKTELNHNSTIHVCRRETYGRTIGGMYH